MSNPFAADMRAAAIRRSATVQLVCTAFSSYGPAWALCNNHITVPLRLGAGNDVTFDAEGWTVMFDQDIPVVRCPSHADE